MQIRCPSEQFPNIRALGLSVLAKSWAVQGDQLINVQLQAGHWVSAADLESLLAKAPVVYGKILKDGPDNKKLRDFSCWSSDLDTHQALLLNVQPIVKDSFEQLAKDLVDFIAPTADGIYFAKFRERARRLLGDNKN